MKTTDLPLVIEAAVTPYRPGRPLQQRDGMADAYAALAGFKALTFGAL